MGHVVCHGPAILRPHLIHPQPQELWTVQYTTRVSRLNKDFHSLEILKKKFYKGIVRLYVMRTDKNAVVIAGFLSDHIVKVDHLSL